MKGHIVHNTPSPQNIKNNLQLSTHSASLNPVILERVSNRRAAELKMRLAGVWESTSS